MKKILLITLFLCVLLITSCVTFPQPEKETDSLVVGNYILDFPDGFFAQPPRMITDKVKLNLLNVTTNTKFYAKTRDGWFYFPYNGKDEIVIESYEYETKEFNTRMSLGKYPLGWKIPQIKGKIIYLENITMTYIQSKVVGRTSAGERYSYDQKISAVNKVEEMKKFIQDCDENSPWLSYEIIGSGIRE